MKPKRQQQFTLTSNPHEQASQNPSAQQLLNQIYTRIKAKSLGREANPSDSNVVLMSYLSHSHEGNPNKEITYNSDSIHKFANSLQQSQLPHADRHKKTKKFSYNQRMKTDIDELDSVSQVEFLRRENQCLKQKLSKCEKRIIVLESFECQAEYMRKLILIQDSEINKLRRMLKATKQSQLSLIQQQNRHPQSCTQAMKEKRNEPILISDHSENVEIDGMTHKKKKCFHKAKVQGLTSHLRTEPIEDINSQKNRSFYSKSREDIPKKNSCKGRKDKNLCR